MTRLRHQLQRTRGWYWILRLYGESPVSALYWASVIVWTPDPDARLVA